MKVESLKYKITLVIDNLITNNLDKVYKNITRKNIELETGIPKEIDKKNLVSYFEREIRTYCSKHGVTMNDLALDGYEIESKTQGVDVYFDLADVNAGSFEPKIMATLMVLKDMPVVRAEQLDETTVKWSWTDNNSVNYLKDENDNIITQLSLGVDYYIESDLTAGGTYTRKLCTTNQFNEQLESPPCIITLSKTDRAIVYDKFQVEKRREDYIVEEYQESTKLKAFASGIGDGDDCKIISSDDTKLSRKFKLLNRIYGIRASNNIMHHSVKFKYRYKLVGTVDYLSYGATFTVRAVATECKPLGLTTDNSTIGTPIQCVRELKFTLDDKTQCADIYMYQLFPELLQKDYKKRYKFDIEIFDTDGDARLYSYMYGYHNILNNNNLSLTEYGYYDHMITITAIEKIKQKEYTEVYPKEIYEPLVGVVNGDFESTPDGLKNMRDTMNIFDTSASVYDKKYYIQFEEVLPDEGYVQYKFDNQIPGTNYTETNGDSITFFSNSFFADDSEHKEFITQIEKGPYEISDNRKHKFTYDIRDIKLDLNIYKRFELDVVPSNNDITIIQAPTNIMVSQDGTVDMPVQVSCRHLQSAIAKWSPSIHNGYYYYNQKEYFLYSKCAPDNEARVIQNHLKKNVNVKVVFQEDALADAEDRDFNIELKTKQDLLLDEYHYEWENDMVWPRPVEVYNDYYKEFAPVYEYYTQPIIFDVLPTKYHSITWDEAGTPNSQIDVYAIAYDDVYGQWYPPVKISNGGAIPSSLKLSKVLLLKFVLKPSRKPVLRERLLEFCCEADWKNSYLKFMTYNTYFNEEILMPTSELSNGVFVSKFIDLGDTSESDKGRSLLFDPIVEGDVEFYVQHADSKTALTERITYADWSKVEIGVKRENLKRFVRYMIVLKPKSKLYHLKLTVNRYEYSGPKEGYLPGFGNISVKAETKTSDSATGAVKEHEHILTHELTYNMQDEILLEDLNQYIVDYCDAKGLNHNNIINVDFFNYDATSNDFDVRKDGNEVKIRSTIELEDDSILEVTQGGIEKILDSEQKVKLHPIPQQYAPIILYADDDKTPYTQVFFTDENGEYTLTGIEEFVSMGYKTLYLKYIDIDPDSVTISIDEVINTGYTINNNIVDFDRNIEAGAKIVVSYKIKKSFISKYDYENDEVEFEVYSGVNPASKINVFYETDKLSAYRQLSHISLNPIYNSRYSGYIYLCDYQDKPQYVEVYPEDSMIYANGKDTMNVLIQVTDKNHNPVEGINVNILSAKGDLKVINSKTDINGVIKCIYTSCDTNCIDTIKATVNDNAKGEAKIINRRL